MNRDTAAMVAPTHWLAGLDPGRSKCGLALADGSQGRVLAAAVLPPPACLERLEQWRRQGLEQVVLGNGTQSRHWQQQLAALGLGVLLVDEWGTTLAARERYWTLHPVRGWRRLLPRGLRLPPATSTTWRPSCCLSGSWAASSAVMPPSEPGPHREGVVPGSSW